MARILVAILLAFAGAVAEPANAEDWWFISGSDRGLAVLDLDSVTGSTETRRVNTILFLPPSQGNIIAGAALEVDCRGSRVRYLQFSRLSSSLDVLASGPPEEQYRNYRTPSPSNNGAYIIRFVCRDRQYRESREAMAFRIGGLGRDASDPSALFQLIEAGVPDFVAVFFALGRPTRDNAERVIAASTPEVAAALRGAGYPR